MKEYGIIGKSLSHSFSPRYFNQKFESQGIASHFSSFELEDIQAVQVLLRERPQLAGLCVTIPYKEAIIPFLDELDPAAAAIGAVNCVQFNGALRKGYNTDVLGFRASLEPLLPPEPVQALVLGTGGAAKAVCTALQQLQIPYHMVSRHPKPDQWSYAALGPEELATHRLLINTTPLGTYPEVQGLPDLPYELLGPEHILYDLVYNPSVTAFLEAGRQRGARIKNGLEMLELQAEENWRLWQAGE